MNVEALPSDLNPRLIINPAKKALMALCDPPEDQDGRRALKDTDAACRDLADDLGLLFYGTWTIERDHHCAILNGNHIAEMAEFLEHISFDAAFCSPTPAG